ncbi:MAG: dihydrolipoyl dehydrogenase family protein [Acidobacteriota bacterium]
MAPREQPTYHALVIGAGPGGLVAAAGLAGLGAKVALFEKSRMGGDCLNTGCVPSKALIASAHAAHTMRTASRFGLAPREPDIDLGAVFDRMRRVRAQIAVHDAPERFEKMGVDVFTGAAARLTSPHTVRAGERTFRGDFIVIATGGRAAVPPIDGLADTPHHTNETFFDQMTASPGSLCVMGGGPIGLEMAQTMARLGVRTAVVEMMDQILVMEDPDAAQVVADSLEADGVTLMRGQAVRRVEPLPGGAGRNAVRVHIEETATGKKIEQDFGALLVAVGRRPNVEDLGLEEAGVAFTRTGITTDDRLRTSRRNIFAIGDVAGPYQFTHFADAQARAVVRNILIPWVPARFDASVVPWCTYTDPECAHVGHNETTARKAGLDFSVHRVDLSALDRAVTDDRSTGFVKVIADAKGRVLGATAVAAGAGDWIHEYVLAMKNGITLPRISGTIHAYPTYGEASRRPADGFMKNKLTPTTRKILAWRWGRR